MELKDLKPGMELMGTVRNVIDFGAFVAIGVHEDGLVPVSYTHLVKSAVKDMAEALTTLYAQRQMAKGFAFSPDNDWQADFEDVYKRQE